jgi:hypothetical protein
MVVEFCALYCLRKVGDGMLVAIILYLGEYSRNYSLIGVCFDMGLSAVLEMG